MPRCLFEHKIGISVVWPERVSRFDIQIGAGISLQYPLKDRKKLVASYTPLSPKLAVRWELRSRRTSEPPPFNFSLMAALPGAWVWRRERLDLAKDRWIRLVHRAYGFQRTIG